MYRLNIERDKAVRQFAEFKFELSRLEKILKEYPDMINKMRFDIDKNIDMITINNEAALIAYEDAIKNTQSIRENLKNFQMSENQIMASLTNNQASVLKAKMDLDKATLQIAEDMAKMNIIKKAIQEEEARLLDAEQNAPSAPLTKNIIKDINATIDDLKKRIVKYSIEYDEAKNNLQTIKKEYEKAHNELQYIDQKIANYRQGIKEPPKLRPQQVRAQQQREYERLLEYTRNQPRETDEDYIPPPARKPGKRGRKPGPAKPAKKPAKQPAKPTKPVIKEIIKEPEPEPEEEEEEEEEEEYIPTAEEKAYLDLMSEYYALKQITRLGKQQERYYEILEILKKMGKM